MYFVFEWLIEEWWLTVVFVFGTMFFVTLWVNYERGSIKLKKKHQMKRTIRQIFEETGTYMWFDEPLPENSIINDLPLKKEHQNMGTVIYGHCKVCKNFKKININLKCRSCVKKLKKEEQL